MQQDRTAIFASKLNSSCIQFLMLGTTALLFGTAWRLEPILLFLQLYQNYRLKPSSKNYYRTHFKRIVNTVITTMQKVSILFTFKWGWAIHGENFPQISKHSKYLGMDKL